MNENEVTFRFQENKKEYCSCSYCDLYIHRHIESCSLDRGYFPCKKTQRKDGKEGYWVIADEVKQDIDFKAQCEVTKKLTDFTVKNVAVSSNHVDEAMDLLPNLENANE
jgi:hypothetical protein